jgi:hypothetical protein
MAEESFVTLRTNFGRPRQPLVVFKSSAPDAEDSSLSLSDVMIQWTAAHRNEESERLGYLLL